MEITINGKQAVLKTGTSFDFIAENSLFTGSDSYTLTITFPLRGCPQNTAIFGHIHRAEVEVGKAVLDCDIRDGAFYKSGSITVTEITEAEVKTQFLEGRSEQNFDETFDEIYLNELDLGYPSERTAKSGTLMDMIRPWPENFWVPLPWVNNTSGNIQNQFFRIANTKTYQWRHEAHPEMGVQTLSFQPYLLYILRRITIAIGYTGDFDALEYSDSGLAYLLICNTLPAAWDATNFALALPHWTLTEFFEELEKFLFGNFAINHKAKTIVFSFADTLAKEAGEVELTDVVDSFTAQVTQEDKSEYSGSQTLRYADNGALMWGYDSCDWYIRRYDRTAKNFATLAELLKEAEKYKTSGVTEYYYGNGTGTRLTRGYDRYSDANKLFYASDVKTYFVMHCYKAQLYSEQGGHKWYRYYNRLYPVNVFGELYAGEDAEEVEMKCVPAWLEDTGDANSRMLYLNCGDMGSSDNWVLTEDGSSSSSSTSTSTRKFASSEGASSIDYDAGDLVQGTASRCIENGEQDSTDAYFDQIYFAFWDGQIRSTWGQPHPFTDYVQIIDGFFESIITPYSLRLKGGSLRSRASLRQIDGTKKYEFSFLSKEMPNPRALFYIRGGRYVCEKITATFTENGMSQLMKGTFYRVPSEE